MVLEEGEVADWQDVISILRRLIAPTLKDAVVLAYAEDLWHQARIVIGEMMQRVQVYPQLRV